MKLTDKEKEILKKWIAQGANYEPHWAFMPPEKSELPSVKKEDWAANEIDYYISQYDAEIFNIDMLIGSLLEEFEKETQSFKEGSLVKGVIIEIGSKYITVDIGIKSVGYVPVSEFKKSENIIKIFYWCKLRFFNFIYFNYRFSIMVDNSS